MTINPGADPKVEHSLANCGQGVTAGGLFVGAVDFFNQTGGCRNLDLLVPVSPKRFRERTTDAEYFEMVRGFRDVCCGVFGEKLPGCARVEWPRRRERGRCELRQFSRRCQRQWREQRDGQWLELLYRRLAGLPV